MDLIKGQARVIIENVQPQVDGGLYPAKRTIGERVDVSANIFGDGHDHIRARVHMCKEGQPWSLIEMAPTYNNIWRASFVVPEKGNYHFTVSAWIDQFDTWYDGFKKKAAAHVDVHVELMEGVQFLKRLNLASNAKKLEGDYNRGIEYVLSAEFSELVHSNPLIEFETTYPKEFVVRVEHIKANFSTWYELFPRSASLEGKHGTFKDVIKLLPRVASMGFDVLYLPPIHPIGKVKRKGKNNNVKSEPGEPGSPWAIGSDEGGHKAVHAELGGLEEYKKLITEAKRLKIDIALDLAFQCAPD